MINGHKETQRRLKKNYDLPMNDIYRDRKGYYVEYKFRPVGAIRFMKKYNNKRLRRFKGELSDGNYYRKVNEHWWNIY